MKKLAAVLMALAMAVLSLAGCAGKDPSKTIYFFNYGDYIDPDLLTEFEKETGIHVVMDTFDTNEEMYPIVQAGQVKYDVVMASDYSIEKMLANGLLSPLNYANIPNASNLEKSYMDIMAGSDPGNKYAIPYNWGTVGIMYNTGMIPEGSITSWRDLWNPAYKDMGILMQDSLRDTFMVAEKILGYDMNTVKTEELEEVVKLLIEQAPLVAGYKNDAARDDLITEDAAIGMIYSGEYLYCRSENDKLTYIIPEEGTNVWFDCFVIPKAARNQAGAEAFINFMLRAEVGLKTFEYLTYPTPNAATIKLIDEEYLNDPAVFPTEEMLERCGMFHYLGEEADRVLASYWKKFRGN